MRKWLGVATILAVMWSGAATNQVAAAGHLPANSQRPEHASSPHLGPRHQRHPYRCACRGYSPRYYDRPIYYAPAPFFGYGWELW